VKSEGKSVTRLHPKEAFPKKKKEGVQTNWTLRNRRTSAGCYGPGKARHILPWGTGIVSPRIKPGGRGRVAAPSKLLIFGAGKDKERSHRTIPKRIRRLGRLRKGKENSLKKPTEKCS